MEPAQTALYRTWLIVLASSSLLMGAALRVPALAALGAAWAILLAAAGLVARRRLRGLRVRRELHPSAFEEDAVRIDLVLEADRASRMIQVADSFGPALIVEHRLLEPGPLGPGLRRRLSYEAFCSRQWGIHTVGPIQAFASDPAGLFQARCVLPDVEEFAVFPRVYEVARLVEAGARSSFSAAEQSAARPGQGPLYLGVRDHRPGDDLRHVHWAASARRGALVLKEYEVDLCPYTNVFVDLERRHRAGTGRKSTLEYVLRTAASVVWTALRGGGFVQLAGMGARVLHVPPGRGSVHLAYALEELIRVAQDGSTPLMDVVLEQLPHVPGGSTAVLVSGTVFLDLGTTEVVLDAFRARGVTPVFFLVDNFSFPAIEGWPPSRAEVVEKRREVLFFLRARGVAVRVLDETRDLEAALAERGDAE